MPGRIVQEGRWFLRRLTQWDRIALVIAVLFLARRIVVGLGGDLPFSGLMTFLFLLAAPYLLFRTMLWARKHALWSLRNRLIVAYLFIAVVPIVLLVATAGVSAYLLYAQLGAHIIQDDLEQRVQRVAALTDLLLGDAPPESAGAALQPGGRSRKLVDEARAELGEIRIEQDRGRELLRTPDGKERTRFSGLTMEGGEVRIRAVAARGPTLISSSVALTPALLDKIAPELSSLEIILTRPAAPGERGGGLSADIAGRRFVSAGSIVSQNRRVAPATNLLDVRIPGFSQLDAMVVGAGEAAPETIPLFVSFSERPSQLNLRLFRSLGELRDVPVMILVVTGGFFLMIEVSALVVGVALTRTITRAVADLYQATERVKAADLTYRVRIQQQDQLGALGDSFNAMTSSISELLEQQRQHQRLENELAIAREVQSQLFPQKLPSLPGVELAALCRAARTVSGDYYDFIRAGPSRLALAVADISGKGISAALLMASLQASLRGQVLLDGDDSARSAELVARVNKHLFYNTSPERYATFFYALYDAETRILQYTNAGHVAPLYIAGGQVKKLEEGGMVVGLFKDCVFQQGTIEMEPGSLLVAYSDGLTEPENVYGEEFGAERLERAAVHNRHLAPNDLAQALMTAAEEWAGAAEQSDDMTVIVARMG